MNSECRVHSEPVLARGRLDELGLYEEVLRDAVQNGLQHAFACTLHDPPSLPGILAWGKTVRHLRDRLIPQGWSGSNARNYATVIHPKGSLAIAVAAGDSNTGCLEPLMPSTRAEKGPATRDAVLSNQLTFADVSEHFPRPESVPGMQTWLLLHYADEVAEEVRLELSLPADMTADGFVVRWHERIILAPIPFTPQPLPAPEEETEEIDIKIERRAT
jgi:hypothetical protein